MDNTGQQLDQSIADLQRRLASAQQGEAFLIEKLERMRVRLNLPALCTLELGDPVEKVGGDYKFRGAVVAALVKRSGAVRVVVENGDGLLFIFNPDQLKKLIDNAP